MGKIFGVIICMLIGAGLFLLASVSDSLICSEASGYCSLNSKVWKYTVSEDNFKVNEIEKIYCKKMYQPARSGKKAYFVLALQKVDGVEFNLGSYKTLGLCKTAKIPMNDFIKGKENSIIYSSGTGIANVFGYIFGVLMFFIAFIIFRSRPDVVEDDSDADSMKSEDG